MDDLNQRTDVDAEALLVAARPAPSMLFAGELERSLFPERTRRPGARFVVGLATTGALAAAFVVASFTGGGPLAPHGGGSAKAGQQCHEVYVTQVEPVGQVVQRADGTVTVETTRRPVSRAERRCR